MEVTQRASFSAELTVSADDARRGCTLTLCNLTFTLCAVVRLFSDLNEEESVHEPQDSEAIASTLPDLDAVGLGGLPTISNSVLVGSLRMLLAEAGRPDEATAGFTSSLP